MNVKWKVEVLHIDGWHVYVQPQSDRDKADRYVNDCSGVSRIVEIETIERVVREKKVYGDGRIEDTAKP